MIFAENHPDLDEDFKGHLWVKELFLNSQYNTIKMNMPVNMMLAMIIAGMYMVAELIDMKLKARKMEKMGKMMDMSSMPKTWEMLAFYIPCIMITFMYAFFNLMFLNIALVDIVRRNYQMMLLSSALEVNF